MAEIKSTIELVMERTKHLIASSEEREQQKVMEITEKIPGYVQKYIDGKVSEKEFLEFFKSAFQKIPQGHSQEIRKKLITSLMERLSLELPIKLLHLIRDVLGSKDKVFGYLVEMEELLSSYLKKVSALKKEITEGILNRLSDRPITGDAIEIIPEETPSFKNFRKSYASKLENMKQQILSEV